MTKAERFVSYLTEWGLIMLEDKWMTTKEVAGFLCLSYGGLRNMLVADQNSLPPYHYIGKRRRWLLSEVQEWMKENNRIPTDNCIKEPDWE